MKSSIVSVGLPPYPSAGDPFQVAGDESCGRMCSPAGTSSTIRMKGNAVYCPLGKGELIRKDSCHLSELGKFGRADGLHSESDSARPNQCRVIRREARRFARGVDVLTLLQFWKC